MPETPKLEDIAKAAPQGEKKEEKKPVGILESVVNETSDAVKATANLGIATTAPALGYLLTKNLGVVATSFAFIAGTKGKKDSKVIRNESLSGAVFGTFAHYVLSPLKYLSNLGKAAYMLMFPFPANSFYMAEDHMIKEKSPKGLYKKLKEDFWPATKKAFKTVVPLNVFSALFLPQTYMVGAIAVASYIYRRFVAGGKGEEQTDKTPYYVAAPSVVGKLVKNTANGLYDSVYAIGSGARDLYKTAPKSAPATKPA